MNSYVQQEWDGSWSYVTPQDDGSYDVQPIDPSDYAAYGIPSDDPAPNDPGAPSYDGGQAAQDGAVPAQQYNQQEQDGSWSQVTQGSDGTYYVTTIDPGQYADYGIPAASAPAGAYAIQQYNQQEADGSWSQVTAWSDGSYTSQTIPRSLYAAYGIPVAAAPTPSRPAPPVRQTPPATPAAPNTSGTVYTVGNNGHVLATTNGATTDTGRPAAAGTKPGQKVSASGTPAALSTPTLVAVIGGSLLAVYALGGKHRR